MKYSQYIGVLLILAFVVVAFQPWIFIPSLNTYINGMDSGITKFGKPALFGLICCTFSLLFFLVPKLWAKRANIIFTTLNVAWALKNFIVLNICRGGECPERKVSLYLQFLLAIGILAMSFLPRLSTVESADEA